MQDTFEPLPDQPEPASPSEMVTSIPAVPAAIPVAPPPPTYRDRSTGLTIFGSIQIILGLLAALMIPLLMLGMFLSRLGPGGGTRPAQFVASVASYASAGAILLTLGIGSIRAKRWARALTLITSWYWLITGVLLTILLTAMLPVVMRGALAQAQNNAGPSASPGVQTAVMAVIVTLIIAFGAFFLIVVPVAFVVFYSRQDVEQTCRHRDPVERWTDRTPLPVLGATVVLFGGSIYMLLIGITTPLFPFFGLYLTGIAGAAGFIVLSAMGMYLAIALYRLKPVAWWLAVSLSFVRILSMAITYRRGDLMQAYAKLGFSDVQLRMLNSNPMFRNHAILWWSLISAVLFFGYLLWLKRYFKVPAAPEPAQLPVPNLF